MTKIIFPRKGIILGHLQGSHHSWTSHLFSGTNQEDENIPNSDVHSVSYHHYMHFEARISNNQTCHWKMLRLEYICICIYVLYIYTYTYVYIYINIICIYIYVYVYIILHIHNTYHMSVLMYVYNIYIYNSVYIHIYTVVALNPFIWKRFSLQKKLHFLIDPTSQCPAKIPLHWMVSLSEKHTWDVLQYGMCQVREMLEKADVRRLTEGKQLRNAKNLQR